jgi:hypothetical protein
MFNSRPSSRSVLGQKLGKECVADGSSRSVAKLIRLQSCTSAARLRAAPPQVARGWRSSLYFFIRLPALSLAYFLIKFCQSSSVFIMGLFSKSPRSEPNAESSPNPLISTYTHLTMFERADEALKLLHRLASMVKPIMRKRNWKVETLAEFYPDHQSLHGSLSTY